MLGEAEELDLGEQTVNTRHPSDSFSDLMGTTRDSPVDRRCHSYSGLVRR